MTSADKKTALEKSSSKDGDITDDQFDRFIAGADLPDHQPSYLEKESVFPPIGEGAPRITITTGRGEKKRDITVGLVDFAEKMTAHRIATLMYIRDHPGLCVRETADGLGRPYRRVRDDVTVLLDLGLLRVDLVRVDPLSSTPPREKLRRGINSLLRLAAGAITATIEL